MFLLVVVVLFAGTMYRNGGAGVATQRIDTSIALTPKADLKPAPQDEIHVSYAPHVPPTITRTDQRLVEVHIEVVEQECEIDSRTGTTFETWGYRIAGDTEVVCGAPGPVIRGRVGDVMRITLTNLLSSSEHHDIDFHAVTGPGGGAKALSVAPGETATVETRLLYPGVFMYHCAHEDPPKHIAHGMYGMIIVDPETPLPPADHEWAVMQSEWYVGPTSESGIAKLDRDALLREDPRFVTFNGRTDALTGDNALEMSVSERARIFFVNQGLSLNSNFHPIGSHWDVVYPEGATHPANRPIYGSQSTLVVAGGGSVVELLAHVPGNIVLVDHALGRAVYKGALGIISVSGDENYEIFEPLGEVTDGHTDHVHDSETVIEDEAIKRFEINAGNFYFSEKEIRVKKGDVVEIVLNNEGGFHDLVIDEFDVATKRLQGGEQDSVRFVADTAGSFEYYCSVGNHRELGQWGTLIVEE